jgi:hypothetical protein
MGLHFEYLHLPHDYQHARRSYHNNILGTATP